MARDEVLREATPHGGVPLILPRRLYSRALAVTGDIGLRELINGLPAEERVLMDLPSAALDVDTRQDLRAARRRRSGISP
jgi:CTP:molybdopterin cytidylyltransferase MocA